MLELLSELVRWIISIPHFLPYLLNCYRIRFQLNTEIIWYSPSERKKIPEMYKLGFFHLNELSNIDFSRITLEWVFYIKISLDSEINSDSMNHDSKKCFEQTLIKYEPDMIIVRVPVKCKNFLLIISDSSFFLMRFRWLLIITLYPWMSGKNRLR